MEEDENGELHLVSNSMQGLIDPGKNFERTVSKFDNSGWSFNFQCIWLDNSWKLRFKREKDQLKAMAERMAE